MLRNLICATIQEKLYSRKSSDSLAQWPENKRPCIGFFNGALSLSATDYFCNEMLNSFTAQNGNSKGKPALSNVACKRVCESLHAHKASKSNFNKVKSQLKAVDVHGRYLNEYDV